ncbi:hypothetical protein M409DRAFT_63438 [Zasmidium cellare ATCC 36951]|uniref:Zn(2)-C6 fungal-type domain-containing protein n=1 Tax=Zasmidium cellare ATCC 36951 TaxID=1080233 RepID=A0A6A6D2N7_ZASCE|nr:uncharacterized protein M409DRAFT_63438 [Zasmidium cellare ATCC 36951]KAF2171896.1 hypothetical protein M409DRAFT_63438 [Zasmidium cellare ATCC 36951]
MPYRGKPSPGCATCRQRKIKCDLRPGGCEKCEKSGWKCEGYRDVGLLMFHDESEGVRTKVRSSQQRSRRAAERSSPAGKGVVVVAAPRAIVPKAEKRVWSLSDSEDTNTESSSETSPPEIVTISPSLDDLAVNYFLDKYVFKYTDRRELWDINEGNGCLHSSILALGLAGATRQTGQGDTFTHPAARKHYLTAIQQTNQALRSPDEVKKDSTLQAINILAIFEILSGYERSLDAWRDHIKGAASLLQLRGPEQFKTHTGCRLFMQTTANLAIACLARRLPMPPHVLAMQKVAAQFVPNPNDSVWRFHCNSIRTVDLHARLLPGNRPRTPLEAKEILTHALDIFQEFTHTLDTAPEDFKPTLVHDKGPTIYAGYYYVFRTSLVTQMFCAMCSYRILLIDIIRKALTAGSADPDFSLRHEEFEQIQESLNFKEHLQLAVLASIPQHFHAPSNNHPPDSPSQKDALWSNFSSADYIPFKTAERRAPDLPFVRMAGGYMIQFPLFTAGAADPPGGAIRGWTVGMLRLLGQTMGMRHAFVLADLLEEGNGGALVP